MEKLSVQTLREMGQQLHGLQLSEVQLAGLAELVGALRDEMQPMLQLDVGENEPATIYQAASAQSAGISADRHSAPESQP